MYRFLDISCCLGTQSSHEPGSRLTPMQKEPENSSNAVRKSLVAGVEINRKQECREDHHHGSAVDFLLRRPGHALHLNADIRDVIPHALQGVLTDCHFVGHNDPYFLLLVSAADACQSNCCLAGAEGLEPP